MQYHPSKQNMMWTVLLFLCTIFSLNGCSDANNVSGPPGPATPGPLTILTASPLPAGTTQVPYDITLAPGGGTPPYTWSLAPGSPALPNGLSLSPSTGNISGTPTAVVTSNTQFRLQDSDGQSFQKLLQITINITPGPLTILTQSLPSGTLNQSYPGVALSATGGRSPYTWDILSGALPAGLNLDSSSGVVSGTPVGGTSTATFRVRDSGSPRRDSDKTPLNHDHSTNAAAYNNHFATCWNSQYRLQSDCFGQRRHRALAWSVTGGQLPPGINLNASNGNISGTPTTLARSILSASH